MADLHTFGLHFRLGVLAVKNSVNGFGSDIALAVGRSTELLSVFHVDLAVLSTFSDNSLCIFRKERKLHACSDSNISAVHKGFQLISELIDTNKPYYRAFADTVLISDTLARV